MILEETQKDYNPSGVRTEEMVLNMGPQHPSTHGVLRLELTLEGEIIKEVRPHIGYLHRCFEKHAEAMTYPQVVPYTDRMDYLASMYNEFGYAVAVENMSPVMQFFSNFFAIRHWLTIVRGIMLKGVGMDVLWPSLAAIIVIGAVILGGVIADELVKRYAARKRAERQALH